MRNQALGQRAVVQSPAEFGTEDACQLKHAEEIVASIKKHIDVNVHYSYPSGIKTLKKRTSDKLKTTPTELKSYLLHKL